MADVARGERAAVSERDGGDEQVHRRDLDGPAAQFRLEFAERPGGVRRQAGFRELREELFDPSGVFLRPGGIEGTEIELGRRDRGCEDRLAAPRLEGR